jgi:hypothetical protein
VAGLAEHAGPALAAAGRDAARLLGHDDWNVVDELVEYTTDRDVLAAAVNRVAR